MMCDKRYLKAIYATANKYGLCERSSECDDLHATVYNLTRKASIRDLTDVEAKSVLRELQKYEPAGKGKMTDAQIRKAWAVFYKLKEFDAPEENKAMCDVAIDGDGAALAPKSVVSKDFVYQLPSPNGSLKSKKATDGERMCGIIKKVTGISASPRSPFKWLSADDGEKVIEYLKRYVRSAERKKK